MRSVVVSNSTETIKFVLVEGVSKKKKSQIETYISYHGCSGVQHVAFSSKNIIKSATLLQNQGIKFLEIPQTYYENIPPVLKKILHDKIEAIQQLKHTCRSRKRGVLDANVYTPSTKPPYFFY